MLDSSKMAVPVMTGAGIAAGPSTAMSAWAATGMASSLLSWAVWDGLRGGGVGWPPRREFPEWYVRRSRSGSSDAVVTGARRNMLARRILARVWGREVSCQRRGVRCSIAGFGARRRFLAGFCRSRTSWQCGLRSAMVSKTAQQNAALRSRAQLGMLVLFPLHRG